MILLAVVLWRMASGTSQSVKEEDSNYTNFLAKLDQGQVKEVTILLSPNSAELKGDYRDGGKFRNVTIANTAIPDITKTLQEKGVRYNYAEVKHNVDADASVMPLSLHLAWLLPWFIL